MYKTESFDELLSEQLQNKEFAREFLLSSMEGDEGLDLVDALKRTINCMGVTEYSEVSGIHRNSISRLLAQVDVPTIDILNRYLFPFGLRARFDIEQVA